MSTKPSVTPLTAADLLPLLAAQAYAAAHHMTPDALDPASDAQDVKAMQDVIAGYAAAHLHQVLNRVVALDSDPSVPAGDVAARLVSFLVERIETVTGERPALPWEPPGVAEAIGIREAWCGWCAHDVPVRSDGVLMAHRGLETPICPGSRTEAP